MANTRLYPTLNVRMGTPGLWVVGVDIDAISVKPRSVVGNVVPPDDDRSAMFLAFTPTLKLAVSTVALAARLRTAEDAVAVARPIVG